MSIDATHRDPNCLFCKIVSGEIPSRKVAEDEAAYAFLDIAPFHRGHTLVIPKRHSESLLADPATLADIAPLADRVARQLVDKLGADGINLFSSAGEVAGQDVFHLHLHLVPRYADAPGLRNLLQRSASAEAADLDATLATLTS